MSKPRSIFEEVSDTKDEVRDTPKTGAIERGSGGGGARRAIRLWLMLLFAVPLAFWFASVCVYSVFWCAGCAFPQTWTVAALPPPLDEWSAQIVIAIFGVAGITRFARR